MYIGDIKARDGNENCVAIRSRTDQRMGSGLGPLSSDMRTAIKLIFNQSLEKCFSVYNRSFGDKKKIIRVAPGRQRRQSVLERAIKSGGVQFASYEVAAKSA